MCKYRGHNVVSIRSHGPFKHLDRPQLKVFPASSSASIFDHLYSNYSNILQLPKCQHFYPLLKLRKHANSTKRQANQEISSTIIKTEQARNGITMRQFNFSSPSTLSCDSRVQAVQALVQRSFIQKYCEGLHYATEWLLMDKRMNITANGDELRRQTTDKDKDEV